jgi:outer membrane lipoprotein-sorting protein
LYIDKLKYFIRNVESTTKQGGNIKINLTYDKNRKVPLPDKVKFSFNMNDEKPGKEIKDPDNNVRKQMNAQNISGDVYIYYSNYKINKGLSDSIFSKEKSKN